MSKQKNGIKGILKSKEFKNRVNQLIEGGILVKGGVENLLEILNREFFRKTARKLTQRFLRKNLTHEV